MTKLIVGLGNPDQEYLETRHNVGWMVLDYIAKKNNCPAFEQSGKLNAEITKCKSGKNNLVLAKTLTYVNKTGEATLKLKNFFKVKPENIIVIQDDLDIEFGNVKISFEKNSGGHRGIESIIKSIKTKKFYRLRMGLAVPALQRARQKGERVRDGFVKKFVLSKFSPSESQKLKKVFKEAEQRLGNII